jgi:hypothetical protein
MHGSIPVSLQGDAVEAITVDLSSLIPVTPEPSAVEVELHTYSLLISLRSIIWTGHQAFPCTDGLRSSRYRTGQAEVSAVAMRMYTGMPIVTL